MQAKPVSFEIIAARIIALAEAGRIEGAGDLRMWRHSEVRLPQQDEQSWCDDRLQGCLL